MTPLFTPDRLEFAGYFAFSVMMIFLSFELRSFCGWFFVRDEQ
jgi:hypothetical protein